MTAVHIMNAALFIAFAFCCYSGTQSPLARAREGGMQILCACSACRCTLVRACNVGAHVAYVYVCA